MTLETQKSALRESLETLGLDEAFEKKYKACSSRVELDTLQGEITKSYKKLSLKNHPDKGGNEDDFKKINKANSNLRSIYEVTTSYADDKSTFDQGKFNQKIREFESKDFSDNPITFQQTQTHFRGRANPQSPGQAHWQQGQTDWQSSGQPRKRTNWQPSGQAHWQQRQYQNNFGEHNFHQSNSFYSNNTRNPEFSPEQIGLIYLVLLMRSRQSIPTTNPPSFMDRFQNNFTFRYSKKDDLQYDNQINKDNRYFMQKNSSFDKKSSNFNDITFQDKYSRKNSFASNFGSGRN